MYDVDQWEKYDPEQIHHVPEGGPSLDADMVVPAISTSSGFGNDEAEYDHPHQDVHQVKEGQ